MLVSILMLVAGLVVLVVGAEFLVKGAAKLATAVGISPLVVGLTVVAFGTSAPELAVSVTSAFRGQPDLAVGNVVGSNIFNILVILGLAAVITPLVVAQQLVRFDVPVMIGISVLVFLLALDGGLSRLDGLLLFGGAIAYTSFLIRQSRRESSAVAEEYAKEFGRPEKQATAWVKNTGFVIGGTIGLVIGSHWLVEGALYIARFYGISELVIGLTIISAGTSLPEVATSVVAALRGERDIAVGNAVGSNIFNILSVLGLASLVAPAGIAVDRAALVFDIPVMIAIAIAALPVFFSGYKISRINGGMFLAYYAFYLAYLFLNATGHDALDDYRAALVYFVVPLTVVTLAIVTWRGFRYRADAA